MKFLGQLKRFAKDESGMTLIDLSVFLIIIGLLTVPMIKSYEAWKYSTAKGTTDNNLASINKAIADYFYDNGRYPCPAVITAAPNTAAYGREDCVGTAIAGNVHFGSVPFVSLKIPVDMALDGWSKRISYTVSTLVVAPAAPPFPATPTTNITVRRYNPTTCDGTENAPMTNAHFVLVSHGTNGVGARNVSGAQVEACPGGASPPLEAENCDGDLEFRADICARNDNAGADYYDDVVYADDTSPSRIWVYSTSTPADPTDIVSTVPQIGINNVDAFSGTADAGVDVAGNILTGDGVTPGAVVSDTMCDTDGNNCFSPDLIGGPADIMNDCGNPLNGGNTMRGLWGGTEVSDPTRAGARARCQRSLLNTTQSVCTSPQYAIGFSGGTILCGP